MSRVYKNKAIVSPSYDGKAKTARGCKLESNNNLALPIHYTLGSELFSSFIAEGIVDNLDGTSTIVFPIDSTINYSISVSDDTILNGLFTHEIVSISGGTIELDYWYDNTTAHTYSGETLSVGENNIELGGRLTTGACALFFKRPSVETTVIINNSPMSYKQITNPNSFTYYLKLD